MNVGENVKEREKLLPVVGTIIAASLVLLAASYFLGNLIYQIP
jgi:hypothetical protein